MIEKDGRVSSRYHYDEFGIPTDAKKFDVNWPGPDNLFGYTGLGYDYYSGLTNARARYYKPELGRFVSEDTYKGDISTPHTQNRYAYVHNNPINWIDPSGHFEVEDLMYLSADNYIEIAKWSGVYKDALDGKYSSVDECFAGVCYKVDKTEYWKANAHASAEAIRNENLLELADEAEEFLQYAADLADGLDAQTDLLDHDLQMNPFSMMTTAALEEAAKANKGKYKDTGGHHIHAKAGFDGHVSYDSREGFAISNDYMDQRGWTHKLMTDEQKRQFRPLALSGAPITMRMHSRIAVDALIAGGATKKEARSLVAESLMNLRAQGARNPTKNPKFGR